MKQDSQKKMYSSQTLITPQKINSYFPLEFDFYNKGRLEQIKSKCTLENIGHCLFISGVPIIGEETGYFVLGVEDQKFTSTEESMYLELSNILAGKFVNLICEQTTALLTVSAPKIIRSLDNEKKLMLELLQKPESFDALICPYLLRLTGGKNIKVYAAFIPSSNKMRFEN